MKSAQQEHVEQAIEDRDRLYRRYRASKKAEYEQLFAIPTHGPLLRKFNATLGHFGIDDKDRMVAFWRAECRRWVRDAPEDIKLAAIQMIGHRIMRIRQRAGLAPFDDPLPGEEDDIWQKCKVELR